MEYGLRHYEALQRLLWFLFFLACLALAYPFASAYQGPADVAAAAPALHPDAFKSTAFWMQTAWVHQKSFIGFLIVYLVWVETFFLAGRSLWLAVQYGAKHLLRSLLDSTISKLPGRSRTKAGASPSTPDRFFPKELLITRIRRIPAKFLLHPVQRLELMLNNPQSVLSAEELTEKERRIVETDWQILWSSWGPFKWLLWMLPLLALVESSWLFYVHLQPAITGAKELMEVVGTVLGSLVPLVQLAALAIAFSLASGLLKRLESLYLSSVDNLLYDQLLSRLPFQSSDTVILLEAMQRHFQELQNVLRRLEQRGGSEKEPSGGAG